MTAPSRCALAAGRQAPLWIAAGVVLVAGRLAGLPMPAAGGVALAGWGATLQLAGMLQARRTPPADAAAVLALQGLMYGSLAGLCLAADRDAAPGDLVLHGLSLAMGAAVAIGFVRLLIGRSPLRHA